MFTVLPPNVGSTNFRQFFNATTGAYAYSAANADVQFFTSRGYTLDGTAWSVDTTGPVAGPSTASASSPNAVYVGNLYGLLLNRTPDAGAASWVDALNSGTSPASVVLGIEASTEYLTDQVAGLYNRYLQRAPDAAGEQSWVDMLASGGTLEQVAEGLVSSPEYFQDHGSSNSGYVVRSMARCLAARPVRMELAGWVAALNSGASRMAVAINFLTSTEYRTDLVQADYNLYLGRSADSAGLAGWLNALQASVTDQAVLAGTLGSSEGFSKWS